MRFPSPPGDRRMIVQRKQQMRPNLLIALALGIAGAASAQAPAPAGKPTMPQVCTNCHKPAPGRRVGLLRERRVQVAGDPAGHRRCQGDRPFRSEDAEGDRRRRRQDTRAHARRAQGARGAGELRREGRPEMGHRDPLQGAGEGRQGRPGGLRVREEARRPGYGQLRADRFAPPAAIPAGHHPRRDQRAVSRVGQGGQPPARRQGRAAGVLLPGRDLPDEPAVAAQGDRARLQEHEGLPRGHTPMGDA